MVTPVGAVFTAETGDMTRSPGHGGFFLLVTGSLRFFEADPLEGGVIRPYSGNVLWSWGYQRF